MKAINRIYMIMIIGIPIIEFLSNKKIPTMESSDNYIYLVLNYIYFGLMFLYSIIFGIIFLSGKEKYISKHISSFYYGMSENELEKYDKKALFRYSGVEFIILSSGLLIIIASIYYKIMILSIIGFVIIVFTGVINSIYSKNNKRFLIK